MASTRRIRIVCISDTHNQTPKLPPGDILIHAGDFSNQGTFSELQKTVKWLRQAQFRVKILVCGNHDVTCDIPFYEQHGGRFHNKKIEDPQRCIDLFRTEPTFVYLNHEAKLVRLDFDDNTYTVLKVFGSPYSPARGFWAFGYAPEKATELWNQVPLDSDLIIAHTPAKGHRDRCSARGTAGCKVLQQVLGRVRPKLFVCGHIHEGHGVEIVTWDTSSLGRGCGESDIRQYEDQAPDSKKLFTVDLSSRSRGSALQNDGSIDHITCLVGQTVQEVTPVDGEETIALDASGSNRTASVMDLISDFEKKETRSGRLQTCVVNAAYMGKNWPHKDGKTFHKPIVIDLDVPILTNATIEETSG
ncbi:hypothetical protein LTR84_007301 [Exophiala bonariae]|uniref:Calcineurin-like phosphoesterase domain-containing protein n=1 Tax=Exophiala bonariae TaxID=1690606 RepID=A0AAV9MZ24_9EURO|nr:hypothetical protein LTR84_007301 [Exophiala bonariae]